MTPARAGLYVHGLNGEWLPAERTEGAGVHRLRVRFPASPGSRPRALLTLGSGARRVVVSAGA